MKRIRFRNEAEAIVFALILFALALASYSRFLDARDICSEASRDHRLIKPLSVCIRAEFLMPEDY